MGMFDHFAPGNDPRFVCSEGHGFVEFQTKDFDCNMDSIKVVDGQLIRREWDPPSRSWVDRPMNDTLIAEVYDYCDKCPAFVRQSTTPDGRSWLSRSNLWCEFSVIIVDGIVRSVTRTSPSLAEWVDETRAREGETGPMSPDEAARRMSDFAATIRAGAGR